MQLVKDIYRLTAHFPVEERFGLSAQMRRSSTSIIANIAEGFGRRTKDDKAHRYTIARGECSEIHAFLLICVELGFITQDEYQKELDLTESIGKMLTGLIQYHSQ